MFTAGRIAFIVFFVVIFVGGLIWAYRKDLEKSRLHFRGVYWIIIAIIAIFSALFLLVKLRN